MQLISANDAARLVSDGDAVLISGSGGGHSVPECLLAALGERFRQEAQPRGLTAISVVGVGDRISLGADHLGQEGLTRRSITSALVADGGRVNDRRQGEVGVGHGVSGVGREA